MSPAAFDLESQKILSFLEEYRVLECTCCSTVFGFQHKVSGALYCIGGCHGAGGGSIPAIKSTNVTVVKEGSQTIQRQAVLTQAIQVEKGKGQAFPQGGDDRVDGGAINAAYLTKKLIEVQEFAEGVIKAPPNLAPPKASTRAPSAPKAVAPAASAPPKAPAPVAPPKTVAPAVVAPKVPRNMCSDMKYSPNLLAPSAKVKVLFAWNPWIFTVAAEEDDAAMTDLTGRLRLYAAKAKPLTHAPVKHEVVISEYDGEYYRARVNKANGDDYEIVFIDYGDKKACKQADMYPMTEEFMKLPVYGLIVHLRLPVTLSTDGFELTPALEEAIYGDSYIIDINKKATPVPGQVDSVDVRLWDLEKENTLNEKVISMISARK